MELFYPIPSNVAAIAPAGFSKLTFCPRMDQKRIFVGGALKILSRTKVPLLTYKNFTVTENQTNIPSSKRFLVIKGNSTWEKLSRKSACTSSRRRRAFFRVIRAIPNVLGRDAS